MKVVSTLMDLRQVLAELPRPLGLVPTMGYLHAGHLSLVQAACQANNSVAVSIFVNPTQFGPREDLGSYPRDLPHDLSLLEIAGVDLVWTPTPESMYPAGYQTWVTVENLTQTLEGARRPGHFRGVTTVVAKLFNAVQPDRVYFGQKDAQQAVVIQRMAADLNYPLEIVICPIVREPDGLALSSRNTYLNPNERRAATVLYRALSAAVEAYERGVREAEELRGVLQASLEQEPLAEVQYVSIADLETLEEITGKVDRGLISMAVYIGKTRLIDNMLVGVEPGYSLSGGKPA